MRISLIVPTLDRTCELERLLDSLCQQKYRNFEVLIADQNPEGFLGEIIAKFSPLLDLQVYSIDPKGVSVARNSLLEYMTGDIVAFPDDDCFYAEDTLTQVINFFNKYPNHEGVIGFWRFPDEVDAYEPSNSSANLHSHVSRYTAFHRAGTHVQFYKRGVISTVGGFDERFGPGTGLPYGCGEDTDYLLRVLESDFLVGRCNEICAFHESPPVENGELAEKWRAYGVGRMQLLKKHQMPIWFKLGNIFYPLVRAAVEGPGSWSYRWNMFRGRLDGLFLRFTD